MASKLQLDPADPGIAEVIAGASVGKELVLREVRVIPTNISETGFLAEVTGITIEGAPEAEEAETEGPSSEGAPSLEGMPMGGYGKAGKASAEGYDQGTPA